MPGVHRVASLPTRWILGAHHGSIVPAHLQSYLKEFTFRFNRQTSRSRGLVLQRLLEQVMVTGPVMEADVTNGDDWPHQGVSERANRLPRFIYSMENREASSCLARTFTLNDRRRSSKENLDVGPERSLPGIAKVEPDHLVERRPAPASHLPQPRNARLGFQDSVTMPWLILLHLIPQRRPRTDQRHLANQHIP